MWFFFKGKEKQNKEIEEIKNSVDYFKKEFKKVAEWIKHLDESKEESNEKIKELYLDLRNFKKRIGSLERQALFSGEKEVLPPQPQATLASQEQLIIEKDFKNKIWEALTDKQQEICWKIAALNKENGDWISIKFLASELYPQKHYSKVRSTLSQYVTVLEDMGYVQRTRKGRETYIMSTQKNPYLVKSAAKIKK